MSPVLVDPNYVLGLTVLAVAGLVCSVVICLLWVAKNFMRSKEGKTIDRAKGRRAHLVLAASLGHYGKLLFTRDFRPEGELETAKFANRKKMKRKTFTTPQKNEVGDLTGQVSAPEDASEQQKLEAAELTREYAQNMLNLSSEKVILQHAGIPVSVAVEDKTIAAGIKGLAAMHYYSKLEKVKQLKTVIEKMKESEEYREVANVLADLYSKISLVDFNVVRNYFDGSWDQSNQESHDETVYMMGVRDGQVKGKDEYKMLMWGGIIIGIAGMCGGIAFAFISKGAA